MWKGKKISVVMPAYNEEAGIYDVIKGFKQIKVVDEIVVVDNNSKDSTLKIAKKLGVKVVKEKKQGYGHACVRALKEASGEYVVLVESDNSFVSTDIYKFLVYIDHFDIVKGGRINKSLISKDADWDLFLKWGNWFISKIIQILYYGPSMSEAGGTFRIIKRKCIKKILPKITSYNSAFLPDMVTLALRYNFDILEIPVNYRNRKGQSKITGYRLNAFFVGLDMIKVILYNRIRKLN